MATAKKSAPAKKAAAPKPTKSAAKPVKKSATKKVEQKKPTGKKVAAKTPVKKAPVKKADVKKAQAKKSASSTLTKKPGRPAKAVAKPVATGPAKKPGRPPKNPGELKPAKAGKADKAAKVIPAKAVPVAPPVQVINPIGGTVIPTVRKAVPGKKAAPKRPVLEDDESKWLKSELSLIRKRLQKEVNELNAEIAAEELRFHNLIAESGEGAGDDQADAGAKTFEREHEISILTNKKILLDQSNHALERIAAGTYGYCENCGKHIGKMRLMDANPRATLCMACREREDRS